MQVRTVCLLIGAWVALLASGPGLTAERPWAFAVVTDPEPHLSPKDPNVLAPFADDLRYLKQTFCAGATADRPAPELIIVPGDIAPVERSARTFAQVLGQDLPWLPVPGNHDQSRDEARRLTDVLGARQNLGLVWGPAGPTGLQYHFTFKDVLFVGLNVFWDGKPTPGGEISGSGLTPAGLDWLKDTLGRSTARYKVVFGHRPAWPFGNRHPHDLLVGSSERRDEFWQALAAGGCQLYLCGHTHHYSTYRWLGNDDPKRWQGYTSRVIPAALGVWQVDAGSVRGAGSAYERVVLYLKVTAQAIEVEAHVWPPAPDPQGRYRVPANSDSTLYRFRIYPDAKNNLSPTAGSQPGSEEKAPGPALK